MFSLIAASFAAAIAGYFLGSIGFACVVCSRSQLLDLSSAVLAKMDTWALGVPHVLYVDQYFAQTDCHASFAVTRR